MKSDIKREDILEMETYRGFKMVTSVDADDYDGSTYITLFDQQGDVMTVEMIDPMNQDNIIYTKTKMMNAIDSFLINEIPLDKVFARLLDSKNKDLKLGDEEIQSLLKRLENHINTTANLITDVKNALGKPFI